MHRFLSVRWSAKRIVPAIVPFEASQHASLAAALQQPEQAIFPFQAPEHASLALEQWLPTGQVCTFRDRVASAIFSPPRSLVAFQRELDQFNAISRMVSMRAAQVQGKHRKTMTAHVRLLAATVVLARRFRSIASLQNVHNHLERLAATTGGEFQAVGFIVKQKFDELSLKLRVAKHVDS